MANPRPIGYFDEAVIESEFRAKFSGCYVQLKHPHLKREFWHIESNNDGSMVNFQNAEGIIININNGVITTELEIEVVFPEEGWYINPESKLPYLFYRHPAKQWRRAPNKENMGVIALKSKILHPLGLNQKVLNISLSEIMETPEYSIINRKYLLQRVDENWSILWFLDVQMGFYNHEQKKYFLTHSWNRLPSSIFKNVVYPKFFSLKV